MTNSMNTFAVYKARKFVGIVSAVSEKQAHKRALAKYGRCEVMFATGRDMARGGRVERSDSSYTHGRSPYPTPDFEARRQAEIAKWKAGA